MTQAQLDTMHGKGKRQMALELQENLEVKVTRDKKEGVCITLVNGNKRMKVPLAIWEVLMSHRQEIALATDFVRGLVGYEQSTVWHVGDEYTAVPHTQAESIDEPQAGESINNELC